jgi:hypothetical protein
MTVAAGASSVVVRLGPSSIQVRVCFSNSRRGEGCEGNSSSSFESTFSVSSRSRMDGMAARHRPSSDSAGPDEAEVLKRFIEAIESGALMDTTPQDVVVVKHLQKALSAMESISTGAS